MISVTLAVLLIVFLIVAGCVTALYLENKHRRQMLQMDQRHEIEQEINRYE